MGEEHGAAADAIEWALSKKLLYEMHLTVPERQLLPRGCVRASVLLEFVRAEFDRCGWFPAKVEFDKAYFEESWGVGIALELRDGVVFAHQRHEIGQMRSSPVVATQIGSVEDGLRAYLRKYIRAPVNNIDGVRIDWDA